MRWRIWMVILLSPAALFPLSAAPRTQDGGPYCISAPEPDLIKAQQRSLAGSGECLLKIDPKTGEVTEVTFLVAPPSSLLKHSVALGFLKWRFRPGKVTHVTIAFEYSRRSGFVCHYQG